MTFWDCVGLFFGWIILTSLGSGLSKLLTDLFRPDLASLRAELKAERAAKARLARLIEDWNKTASAQNKARMNVHAAKYQPPQFWDTLGIAPTTDKQAITKAFKAKAKLAHPDKGGSETAMQKLYEARNAALEYAK